MKVEDFNIPMMYSRVSRGWDSDCSDIIEGIRKTGRLETYESVASSFTNYAEGWHGLSPTERGEWK